MAPDAHDRRIQLVEPDIGKPCGDLRPDPKRFDGFMREHDPMCLRQRCEHQIEVPGLQRAKIDDRRRDAIGRKLPGRLDADCTAAS
jgi:hypothetical protein